MDRYRPESPPNGTAILFMMSGGWVSKWAPPEQTKPLIFTETNMITQTWFLWL
ncbi:MAG: hypothetical protein L7V86_03760 [Verrucomicrobiales bacterium]|nr:hypothetical protein [Verrucomicrobiales bacterium]